jgi:hypothetical protein
MHKVKRAYKKYLYVRTQELFKKNPSLLAKCIREGMPWADEPVAAIKLEDIKTYYQELWGNLFLHSYPSDRNTLKRRGFTNRRDLSSYHHSRHKQTDAAYQE